MKVLIRQARIISPNSSHHGSVKDILIENGIISAIESHITGTEAEEINIGDLHISLGWTDIFANFSDPGEEHKETLETGALTAAAGGFTDVMIIPNTSPALSSKSQIEYISAKTKTLPVNIHPIGSVTVNAEGKQLAEMYDMSNSGAVAFSDGIKPVQSPGILLKALQYVTASGATIIQMPDDTSLGNHGLMHEGITSTKLGLPGKPAIAEELMISRDIELLKYTGSRLHLTGISTRKGMELVKEAKKQGLNISCSIAPYQLIFCDEDLTGYDTNLKLNPPLRTRKDMEITREAFIRGEIDCIASHHLPQHWDDKTCEFEYAKYGMISLQTVFPVLLSTGAALDQIIEMLTIVPRKIFGLPVPVIEKGAKACLTLFNPDTSYTFDESINLSRSANSPFIGKSLKGKAWGIINGTKIFINK